MLRKTVISSQVLGGLRTRYFPKSRIGQGLISVAPWLNVVLLCMFFAILDARFVLQPGVVVRLPVAPFAEGLRSRMTAVVLSLETGLPGARMETVVFDDAHYAAADEKQMERLKSALRAAAGRHPDDGLIVLADRGVQLGTVVRIFNMAREAGIREVNLGAREESAGPEAGGKSQGSGSGRQEPEKRGA